MITPSVGAPTALADWSQPGGNAANAPGNVSLDGASGAASWRVRAVEKASKRNVRPSVPPIVYGGREVWPLIEGGKGIAVSNHMSSGAWAAGAGGLPSAASAKSNSLWV